MFEAGLEEGLLTEHEEGPGFSLKHCKGRRKEWEGGRAHRLRSLTAAPQPRAQNCKSLRPAIASQPVIP